MATLAGRETPLPPIASGVGAVPFGLPGDLPHGGGTADAWLIALPSMLPPMLGIDLPWPRLRARVRPRDTRKPDLA